MLRIFIPRPSNQRLHLGKPSLNAFSDAMPLFRVAGASVIGHVERRYRDASNVSDRGRNAADAFPRSGGKPLGQGSHMDGWKKEAASTFASRTS